MSIRPSSRGRPSTFGTLRMLVRNIFAPSVAEVMPVVAFTALASAAPIFSALLVRCLPAGPQGSLSKPSPKPLRLIGKPMPSSGVWKMMKVADWPVAQLADQVVVHDDLGDAAVGHAAHEAGPAELGVVDLEPEARRQQHARRGDHPHQPGLLVRGLQHDHGQPDIGPVLGGDALDQRALLGLGARRGVAADLPVAVDGADRALGVGAAASPDGAATIAAASATAIGAHAMRSKHVAAEFAHHPVPDWSEIRRRMRTNRSHLDTTARARLSYHGRPAMSTIAATGRISQSIAAGRRVPASDRQYMQNIQIVASDSGPCTLRLRRNYGLRGPGNPLPPHRLPRSAAPPGRLIGSGY